MYPYIPITEEEKELMLAELGMKSTDELFSDIPEKLQLKRPLDMPNSKSELEVKRYITNLARKNTSVNEGTCYLGQGAYDHYIPSAIQRLTSRTEFLTSYTPYQPEVSQGTLQYIFEFQSMMVTLTGLDVANASLYDGGTAIAEAALMCSSIARKEKVIISKTTRKEALDVLRTYAKIQDIELIEIEEKDGLTDIDDLKSKISDDIAAVVIQSPNFFGNVEDLEQISEITHNHKKCSMIASIDPSSLGVLKKPSELGVDIVVGEAQCFGVPLGLGGPYLGYMVVKKNYMRKIPGRVVGQTVDKDNKRSFVLTLTAREQHIRREKATSNICSNQGINCLVATMYLSLMGKEGLKELGEQCIVKSKHLHDALIATGKFEKAFSNFFFKEFTLKSKIPVDKLKEELLKHKIFGPFDLSDVDAKYKDHVIFAVTEKRTKEELDELVKIVEGIK